MYQDFVGIVYFLSTVSFQRCLHHWLKVRDFPSLIPYLLSLHLFSTYLQSEKHLQNRCLKQTDAGGVRAQLPAGVFCPPLHIEVQGQYLQNLHCNTLTRLLQLYINHVERKVPKYENHKLRERKVKTLTRNWRDHQKTGTHKHTETITRYFDKHGRLSQYSDWERWPCLSKYLDIVSVCLCVPVFWWSLQFQVRVFSFLSLNLSIIYNI